MHCHKLKRHNIRTNQNIKASFLQTFKYIFLIKRGMDEPTQTRHTQNLNLLNLMALHNRLENTFGKILRNIVQSEEKKHLAQL